MDEKPVEEKPAPAPDPKVKRKMPNVWKFLTLVLLALLLVVGAFYLGTKKNSNIALSPTPTPGPSQTPSVSASPSGTVSPTSPTPTPKPTTKKLSAGVKTDFFSAYTIDVPAGWVDKHTYESTVDKLVLTKGGYSLTISEGGGGGGGCTYPGEAPQQMSQSFTSFVGITGTAAQLRRGTSDNINYTVCEKKTSSFGFPTQFGYITYITPTSLDSGTLSEMDGMVASITKQ